MIVVYTWSTLLVVTAHLNSLTRRLPVYMSIAIATCRLVNEYGQSSSMYTHLYEYSFGLVRPHQQITTQQNDEISDLLLHNPGQYCFIATLQACFVHVCALCVHACMCVHSVCVLACVCVCTWPSVFGYLCIHEREREGERRHDCIKHVLSTSFPGANEA